MADQVRTIRVVTQVNGEGLKALAKSMGDVNKSVKDTSVSMGQLKGIVAGWAGANILGFGVRDLVAISDEMQLLGNRLVVLTGGAEQAAYAFKGLIDISNNTYAPVNDVADSYTRMAGSVRNLGLSTDSLLGLTRVMTNSFRVSGSTTQEASNAMIQFAQALSFGKLSGQEFRSVVMQNNVLQSIFSKEAEKSGKSLKEFAEGGNLTTKFMLEVLAKNFKSINEDAAKLTPTISQALTPAINELKVAIKDLNESIGASSAFNSFIQFLLKNKDAVIVGITTLATAALPLLGAAIKAATVALAAFLGVSGLMVGTFAAIGAAVGLIVVNLGNIKRGYTEFMAILDLMAQGFKGAIAQIGLDIAKLFNSDSLNKYFTDMKESARINFGLAGEYVQMLSIKNSKFTDSVEDTASALAKQQQALEDAANSIKVVKSLEQQLGDLNNAFRLGTIDADSYATKLVKLTTAIALDKLKKGTDTFEQFNKAVRTVEMDAITIRFQRGTLSLQNFQAQVKEINLAKLNDQFAEGKLDMVEYLTKLQEFQDLTFSQNATIAASNYLKTLGNTSKQIVGVMDNAFGHLETAMLEFIKTGIQDWKGFTQAILDDINKVIIRAMIIQPIANGILQYAGAAGASDAGVTASRGGNYPVNFQAMGGAWSQGIQAFANGGIFSSPTMFAHAGGLGVMGEAGPEAIMPLSRDGSGSLGVKATTSPVIVNVVNNTGANVSQSETSGPNGEKILEVIIGNKVTEGIATGKFDKAFQSSFGLRRRGV